MLALADGHLRADRLMAPRRHNALAMYRKVLRKDPGNASALAGIESIKSKLLRFASDASSKGDLELARSQINKVLIIDAGDEAALTALAKLGQAVSVERHAGTRTHRPER